MDDRIDRYTGLLVGMWVFYNTLLKILANAVMLFQMNHFNVKRLLNFIMSVKEAPVWHNGRKSRQTHLFRAIPNQTNPFI